MTSAAAPEPEPPAAQKLAALPKAKFTHRGQPIHQSWTRHHLAWAVLIGYLTLLAAVVGTAIALVFTSRPVNDVQEVVVTLGGALSALAGILGFVVGYYFKSEESAAKSVQVGDTSERADAAGSTS